MSSVVPDNKVYFTMETLQHFFLRIVYYLPVETTFLQAFVYSITMKLQSLITLMLLVLWLKMVNRLCLL